MRRAIIYCRVSTKVQEEGESLDDQERVCREHALNEPYEVPDGWVFREATSGESLQRPILDAVRQLIRQGGVDALIVKSVDRLSRDPVHTLLIAEECDKHGVKLLFVKEPADWSLEGQLLTFVRGWASKVENVRRVERSRVGKEARRRQGYITNGDGSGLYGYRRIARDRDRNRQGMRVVYGPDPGRREVYEPEAEVVRLVFSLLVDKRLSLRKIAAYLGDIPAPEGGKWHPTTLRRMMGREAYIGDAIGTPAIVDRRTFNLAQEQLARNKEMATRNLKNFWLLRGHVFCECGQRMYGCTGNGRRYYRCAGRWGGPCDAPAMRAEGLEEAVWQFVDSIFRDPTVITATLEANGRSLGDTLAIDSRIGEIDRKVRDLRKQERRLVTMLRYGEIDEDFILQETRRIKAEVKELVNEKESILALQVEREERARLKEAFNEFRDRWLGGVDDFTDDDKHEALETLRVKARVKPDGTVTISTRVPVIASPSSR